MLLIGSHALGYRIGFDKLKRNPVDYDLMCTYDEFHAWSKGKKFDALYPANQGKKMIAKYDGNIIEFELAWEGSTAAKLLWFVNNDLGHFHHAHTAYFGRVVIPSIHLLFALKMSHRFLKNSPHFQKTRHDIQLLKEANAYIPEQYMEWFKQREKATYTYKHPNLKQGKDGFFNPNEGVKYIYDHDSIHVAMAHMGKPAYEFYKSDRAEVFCDKEKFFSVDESVRLYGVLEEAYVLALERSQVPFKGDVSPMASFNMALEKVCTSITSGWFRAFAWDNYDKVMELYNPNYVQKFWDAVETGIVKHA